MSRFVLKYIYLVLGFGLALLLELPTSGDRRQLLRAGEARPPMEAATYRANELVKRPLRTLGLLLGYELIFFGIPACAAYPDQIAGIVGQNLGGVVRIIGGLFASAVSVSLLPFLPFVGAVLGVVFALIVHQSMNTANDIRRHMIH